MNYQEADQQLQGRCYDARKIANNTWLERLDDELIGVRLHSTYIVKFRANGDVIIDSGGWRTVTTKERINRYAFADTPDGVYQEDFDWFVRMGDEVLPFRDGMTRQTRERAELCK